MLASSNTMLTQLHGQNADQTREYPLTSSERAQRLSLPKNKKTKTTAGNSTGNTTAGAQATRMESDMPKTAIAYARMCEFELGVPPKIILDEAVEIPIFIDGEQVYGNYPTCDNPVLIGKSTVSGSVIQRYEGRTAEGVKLPHVVWVAFGRNSSSSPARVVGSVQMIGYNTQTGATAFFESGDQIAPWVSLDKVTWRMRGTMPWIDDPKEFNQAFVPAPMQCVQCHQSDPFITNSFITAAKIPGTNEPVIPLLAADSPYHVIGGSHWDMRTIRIKGNACFDCHRVGMKTIELFTASGWNVNEHMPPDDPGSLSDDYEQLLTAWQQGRGKTGGSEWIIPPSKGSSTQTVGDDYPYQAAFNRAVLGGPDFGMTTQITTVERLRKRYFDACRKFAEQVANGTITPEEADEQLTTMLQEILTKTEK